MTSECIFLVQDTGQLVEMTSQPYDSEALLQSLLADYPTLLSGNQIQSNSPRRWLLIAREMAVPSEEIAGRWSIDHLFLDQDAIPTLVEVKRSSDTRIRREVVGQMLDYAANAVVYWPIESIYAAFQVNCELQGRDPKAVMEVFLGLEVDQDQFWQKAKTNLQAGRVRMVFVADEIPSELQRIVEFLNQQMDPAEVLAVEIKQYIGQGLKTLVPRVIGQTAEAQQKKSTGATKSSLGKRIGAKDYIRRVLAETGMFRIEQGLEAGYTDVTLRTALSDLKNPKYCGNGGPLDIEKRADGSYVLGTSAISERQAVPSS